MAFIEGATAGIMSTVSNEDTAVILQRMAANARQYADAVLAAQALRRQPSVEEVARVIHGAIGTGNTLGSTYAESMPAAVKIARQIAALYQGKGEG